MNFVSIILPVHNSEETLSLSIESVLSQSHKNFELLIFDDGSKDGSLKIIESFAARDPRIIFFRSEENFGVGHARSCLLEKIRGNYIAFIDSDDVWFSNKLEAQLDYAEKNNADIVTSWYKIHDHSLRNIGARCPPPRISGPFMLVTNWLPTSFSIVRSDLISSRSMPKIRRRQDYAYWLRIFRDNDRVICLTVPEYLGSYCRRSKSLSGSPKQNVLANFYMFRSVMNFPVVLSAVLVLANGIFRLFRG